MITNVQFTRMSGPYRTGEVAGFEDDHARRIVASGAAVLFAEQLHPETQTIGGIPVDRLDGRRPPQSSQGPDLAASAARAAQIVVDAGGQPTADTARARRGSLGDAARAAQGGSQP